MKVFIVLASVLAISSALPTSKDATLSAEDMQKIMDAVKDALPVPPQPDNQELIKLATEALTARSTKQAGSSDEVVTTLTDVVNTLTSINGMNEVGVDNTDVVNTAVGLGNVEVQVGSSGDTVKTTLGDLVNTIGAIQGYWYNYDIANVNVKIV